MKILTAKAFDSRWQNAKKKPQVLSSKCKTIQPNITMTSVVDRFLAAVEYAVKQHDINAELQKEILEAADNFKKVLSKVPEKKYQKAQLKSQ